MLCFRNSLLEFIASIIWDLSQTFHSALSTRTDNAFRMQEHRVPVFTEVSIGFVEAVNMDIPGFVDELHVAQVQANMCHSLLFFICCL